MKSIIYLIISIFVIGIMSCQKENSDAGLPKFLELSIADITNITGNTATANGTISSEGNSAVVVYGACWSTSASPTTASDKTSETPAGTSITTDLQDLDPGTAYHLRLYATNSQGTAYSNEITFSTATFGSVTDIDGNVYRTVKIGTQIWMADNLKTTRLNNNGFMPNVTDNTQWKDKTSAAYCYHNNDAANNAVYGKLYNWYAVNTGKLAPAGWHVPDSTELQMLIDFLGGMSIAGGALKATTLWNSPNTGATNSSNFTWYPAGSRYGHNGVFVNFGGNGFAWTSTSVSASDARFYNLGNSNGTGILKLSNLKSSGFSVRCLKD
jgi:uncharacterized protein (TIGR02145 family)